MVGGAKFYNAVPETHRLDAGLVARHKQRLQHDIVGPLRAALSRPPYSEVQKA